MKIIELAKSAKKAALETQSLSEDVRTQALKIIASNLRQHKDYLIEENKKDLDEAVKNNLSTSLIDRLKLDEKTIFTMASAVEKISEQKQVVGEIVESSKRPNGLIIEKVRIPIGVIGMIFESRPNVVVDGAALAIKSGNSIILKGGKEAQHSNQALYQLIIQSIEHFLPKASVQMISSREDVFELLKLSEYIDLMVPRGGTPLIQFVKKHATMPVVAHDKGLCHIYIHSDADEKTAAEIVVNAKAQRPGVCNAVETLLLHKDFSKNKEVLNALKKASVEIRGDSKSKEILPDIKAASEDDYNTEYLEKIISVKIVDNENEAIDHILKYGSHHTEAILAQDSKVIEKFLNSLDASCLVVNASTRFNDGGELGLGAELGISTSKLHAYGPMGAKEMTTCRFVVRGQGQTRN
jgi:glutamate-5-semialdehyde dehydrogenase